jgi:hypothetical protein
MKWLDSVPVKFLNFFASVVTILGFVGGGILGVEIKGDAWGKLVSLVVGGFAGMAIMVLFAIAVWAILRSMMRTCPVCKGEAWIRSSPNQRTICPKCDGNARIL